MNLLAKLKDYIINQMYKEYSYIMINLNMSYFNYAFKLFWSFFHSFPSSFEIFSILFI